MGLFLLGIVGGIALSLFFSFGPAFFSQIQASIHYGFRNAVPFAFGVSTSDVLMVALLLLISQKIPPEDFLSILHNRWLLYAGALVVTGFGLYTMFVKTRQTTEIGDSDHINYQNMQAPSRLVVYFRGLTLNFFNPLLWLYWCTVVTIILLGETDISVGRRYLFFAGILSATLGMDVLKCKLASLLQRIITYRFLKIFNKCVGLIIIGFAIFMVVSASPRHEQNNNQRSIEMMQDIMHTKPPKVLER